MRRAEAPHERARACPWPHAKGRGFPSTPEELQLDLRADLEDETLDGGGRRNRVTSAVSNETAGLVSAGRETFK